MNRAQRRAAAQAAEKARREAAAFTYKMNAAKEAKRAMTLYLQRQVKLVALPTPDAIALAQRAVQQRRARQERRA